MPVCSVVCFHCRKKVEFTDRIGRKDECPHCRTDLHACKNCQHYDSSAYNECKEPSAERVLEKEKSNFCDFFSPSGEGGQKAPGPADLKAAAEALFKKL